MTLLLVTVGRPEEAQAAVLGGADVVELSPAGERDPSLAAVRHFVEAVAGRCKTSVLVMEDKENSAPLARAEPYLDCGLDFVRVPIAPQQTVAAGFATSKVAGGTRLIAVVAVDGQIEPASVVRAVLDAELSGVMLHAEAARVLSLWPVPALAAFVRAARSAGLISGFSGQTEDPDIPRLLATEPDLLGIGPGAADRPLDLPRLGTVRTMVPGTTSRSSDQAGADPQPRLCGQRIFVRDLVLPVRIGAYSDERTAPQKVRFNVSVELDFGAGKTTGMGQVLSYDLITDGIAAIVAEGHIDLAETLAERIAAHVLRQPRARRVTVQVEKLERGPAVVGVEIVAERAVDRER